MLSEQSFCLTINGLLIACIGSDCQKPDFLWISPVNHDQSRVIIILFKFKFESLKWRWKRQVFLEKLSKSLKKYVLAQFSTK